MRAAPADLYTPEVDLVFGLGCEIGVLTHGHPNGYAPAGALAAIVCGVVQGRSLVEATETALRIVQGVQGRALEAPADRA